MSNEINGFDDMLNNLDNLQENISRLSGRNEVTFSEAFTSSFMSSNTRFSSIDSFLESAGIHSEKELDNYPESQMDEYVKTNSRFNSWQDMIDSAVEEYVTKQIGF